jgi:hypothetical protein
VGACASFVIAAGALGGEAGELSRFAASAAPRINRIGAILAVVIPLTGIGNLVFAARLHRYALPPEFVALLAAKITLFAAMAFVLAAAWRVEAVIRANECRETKVETADIGRLGRLYGAIVAMGAVALGLGVWLSGT